jgi:predicted signal transduction protein with EAL and GGDEF domain
MRSPFMVRSRTLDANASIGVAGVGSDSQGPTTSEVLLKQVDLALYAAKEKGKNTYAVFHSVMWENFDEEMTLRHKLAAAVQAGRLDVVYQPIHELSTRRIVGLEALARWSDEELGDVPPGRFIPVAERANLIAPIGGFVLERACREFVEWNGGTDPLPVGERLAPAAARSPVPRHRHRRAGGVLDALEPARARGDGDCAGGGVADRPGAGPAARPRDPHRHR